MYVNDVIKYCKEHGKNITRMGLYIAGKKNNFIIKEEGKKDLIFDKDKFLEWFEKCNEEVPDSYISIKDMSVKYGLSLSKAYLISKDARLNSKKIGSKGVMYVDESRLGEVIKENKNKRTYDWN